MATRQCPKCKESINIEAKTCKHCKADLRNWFVKHKIITGFLIIMIIGAIGSAKDQNTTKSVNTNNVKENSIAETTQESNSKSEDNSKEDNKKISKENCDLISTGMTTQEVKNILGEPSTSSETEIEGLGKTEYLHFQEGLSFEACSITTNNGKVTSKTWTKL